MALNSPYARTEAIRTPKVPVMKTEDSPIQENKQEEHEETSSSIDLDITKVASFFAQKIASVKFCHVSTTSYEHHKASDKLVDKLRDLEDDVLEQLSGYCGMRPLRVDITSVGVYTEEMLSQNCYEIMEFSRNLEEWAEDKYYCNISNLAQELSGAAAHTLYRLSLK